MPSQSSSTANASTASYSGDNNYNEPTFYISDFDISTNLTALGIATGIDDVSVNKHQDLSFDVAVVCDLSLDLIKNTFCVLADSNLELDQTAPTNTEDLSYVYNVAKAGELVNELFSKNYNSIRGFKTQSGEGTLSDRDGPEFIEDGIDYDINGVCSAPIATTSGQVAQSVRYGNGQVQDDFMRHLSYRLFNVPTAADVLKNSISVSENFRKSYLQAFTKAIVEQSADDPTDVSYTFAFVDGGGVSTVTAGNQDNAPTIDFSANEAGGDRIEYLPSVVSEKLWDKLVTYSRNENTDNLANTDARWSDISGNSTEGVVDNNDRTRIKMLLQAGDQLVFLLRANFADNQLDQTAMDGRRTSRVYKIIANLAV